MQCQKTNYYTAQITFVVNFNLNLPLLEVNMHIHIYVYVHKHIVEPIKTFPYISKTLTLMHVHIYLYMYSDAHNKNNFHGGI